MFWKIYILMLLCHVIDDFVLQPVCLTNMKQRKWWEENVFKDKYGNLDHRKQHLYKNDYMMALIIHCISWSAMIHLPIMFFIECTGSMLYISFVINLLIHYIVDDLKANEGKINLITDQVIHFIQIILTSIIFFIFN